MTELTRRQKVDAICHFALEQRSKPYVFGAAGPDAFDCSGLVLASFREVGITLPHSAFAQFKDTKRVFFNRLRPQRGDLVFYYTPVDHVAIYLGNGYIIQAGDPELGIERVHTRQYANPVAWGRVRELG